ncbi:histidine kinase [Pseudomonas fluorescens HK44]|uniref:Histidine kinase n=2 Tax=Pseudomonas fluorescens TaxID=294 RepID=A0A010RUH2_PSEFL|nr:EAL domain-containing protein [Pseudomonas fluorescens]EXF95936.1 histidine kinase [Pseudomonas fluorescens HK44]
MIIDFMNGAALLLALCWLHAFILRCRDEHSTAIQLVSGLLFGATCVIGMLSPISPEPGIFFDSRSVVLSMVALFSGPLVAGVAGVIASIYRLWMGGSGMAYGLAEIGLSILLGLSYRHFFQRGTFRIDPWQLWIFGLLMSVLDWLLLPATQAASSREQMAVPLLLVMPIATVVLGLMFKEVAQRKRTELALQLRESRLRAITEAIPDTLLVLDEDGLYLEVTPSKEWAHADAWIARIGQRVQEVLPQREAERFMAFIKQTLASDEPQFIEYTRQSADGIKVLEGHAQRLDIQLNGKQAVVVLARDITQRVNAEHELRIAAAAFETQQGMIITDEFNRILRVNQAFSTITGYSREEAIGQRTSLLNSGRQSLAFYQSMWQQLKAVDRWQGEIWNRRKNGEIFPEWLSISAVRNSLGQVINYVASIDDTSERKAAEERIQRLAFFDGLTDLPNRSLLLDRLQHALDGCVRSGECAALMFLDLDGFKNINDLHGHHMGDKVLCLAAARLNGAVRVSDTVARLGGDEFVVLLEHLNKQPEQAAMQVEHVTTLLLATLAAPYQIDGLELRSSASIGVTLFNDRSCSIDELMQRADLSMYEAKAAGKHTVRFFDPRMQEAVIQRLNLEQDIRRGLQSDEFIPYLQPQLDDTGRLLGAEVLARWQHPQRGLLSPAAFVEVAEHAGLIETLDLQMLQKACRQLALWRRQSAMASLSLSVNLSARLLYQTNFVERVLQLLEQSGADPHRLKLELTETLLLDDLPGAIARISELKAHGIRFSIDDFGTGYSSLAYLQQLSLDQLKIDQSFVRELPADTNSLAIIRAICALASSLQLEVIAEGVESQEQYIALLELGCRSFQGYLFGRPMPLIEFERLIPTNTVEVESMKPMLLTVLAPGRQKC